jgi:hypothetical protein
MSLSVEITATSSICMAGAKQLNDDRRATGTRRRYVTSPSAIRDIAQYERAISEALSVQDSAYLRRSEQPRS